MFPGLAAALPHIRSGRVKPLAITGSSAPADGQGRADADRGRLQGLRRACSGTASSARRACRRPIVKQLNDTLNATLAAPDMKRQAVRRGGGPDADDAPSSSAQYIQAEVARWTALAKERNIQVEE